MTNPTFNQAAASSELEVSRRVKIDGARQVCKCPKCKHATGERHSEPAPDRHVFSDVISA